MYLTAQETGDTRLHQDTVVQVASPHYGYGQDALLGGAVYERELLLRLGGFGIATQVVMSPLGKASPARNVDVTVVRSRHTFRLSSTVGFYSGLRSLWRLSRFDLLRAHSVRAPLLACEMFRRLTARVPLAVHVHHLEGGDRWFHGIRLDAIVKRADAVLTVSDYSANVVLQMYGVPSERVVVIPVGIDTEKYTPMPLKESFGPLGVQGRPLLLYVGSLIPRKNLFFLCDVIHCVRERFPEVLLLIAGEGYQRAALRRYILSSRLGEHIVLVDGVSEERKIDLYNRCDVFVFPSLLEGFGMAPAEAMACGKTVVVSRGSALRELVQDGQNGFLASSSDVHEFAERVEFLLKDSSLRQRIGMTARQSIVKRYSWDQTACRVAEVYRRILI